MPQAYALGLDVGSTTIKAVLLADGQIVHQEYRRHNADVQAELIKLVDDVAKAFPGISATVAITGSGGLGIAAALEVEFIQEVIAATFAVQQHYPQADVAIELGGEDAKITYLKPVPEQRMNGTCAGGTGAFIDQMAVLLRTDAPGLNALAANHLHLYPIASRCGVFAKSDLQPLINEGARHEDLAASIFQAVATQTISGLAQGRPIKGQVILLGGPLHFLPELRAAFERALAGRVDGFIVPEEAQIFIALGAAEKASKTIIGLEELAHRLVTRRHMVPVSGRMPALFASAADRQEFTARHQAHRFPRKPLEEARGALYLGIDAGSTTIKAVLIDGDDNILWTHYAGNQGDPVAAAVTIATTVRQVIPGPAIIAQTCVTGYGEALIKAALHLDCGEVETMAHFRAAEKIAPGVTSVIDIGGQDMKYMRVDDQVIDSIAVNEACSAGCGSFLQTFAESMGLSIEEFTAAACQGNAPVDLGSRCTVFMNSSVKQAQKEGASVADIAAGLSYAVIRNALYKVIKLRDADQLGATVVVQGGTFLNDAVLRAFELLTGRSVVRPDIAGLMGAYGAALTAKASVIPGVPSSMLAVPQLRRLHVETETTNCQLCQNHCQCTIATFGDGERHVSGNRCERGADPTKAKSSLPNLFDYTYRRLFSYRRLTAKEGVRGDIGIPRALNMYENYPLWFTILSALKFRVVISGRSSHDLFEKGMGSIASENVCYPAKLVHGHIESLLEHGVKTIFYPSVNFEQKLTPQSDKNFNCPVVASYPQVIQNNLEGLRQPGVRLINPYFNLADPDKLAERLVEVFADFDVSLDEAKAAVQAGYAEDQAFREDVRQAGREARQYCRDHGLRGIVLAGRPYHLDPEIHHGIPELVTSLGMVCFTEDSVIGESQLERPLRVRDQWSYHTRLYEAAAVVTADPDLELVQLNSFGCGLDAITSEQVAEILEAKNRVYTILKIDEVSNLGTARIRLRSLAAAADQRRDSQRPIRSHAMLPVPFTKEMKARHTLLAPQMAPIHFRLVQPIFKAAGYNMKLLEHASHDDVETGLRTVNNDACYPAIMVIGQLVHAFTSGEADPANTSVLITQTGGMCRATNYTGLLRKALRDAGYGHVPVIAISTSGIESNPGFKLSLGMMHKAMRALALGDLLQDLLLRVRPYEVKVGSATALYHRWDSIAREWIGSGRTPSYGRRRLTYSRLIEAMVDEFDALPLQDIPRKPRVGIVGEILVKFQPDANNHVIDVIESEGCEAALPGLMEFMLVGLHNTEWNIANLGVGAKWSRAKIALRSYMESYRQPIRRALRAANQRHQQAKFTVPGMMSELASRAQEVTSLGNQAGEGWLLTGEILELIHGGAPNVICVQPFACLPNHVVGKGMFKEIRSQHPGANLVAIDYDPGASEVNQLNRIKLMLATAHMVHDGAVDQAPAPEPLPSDQTMELLV